MSAQIVSCFGVQILYDFTEVGCFTIAGHCFQVFDGRYLAFSTPTETIFGQLEASVGADGGRRRGGKSRNGAHAACQLRNLQLFGCESDGLSISGSRLVDGESSDDVLGFGLQVGNLDTESFGFQADGPGFVRRGWLRHTFLINFVSKPALCNVLSSIIGDVAA